MFKNILYVVAAFCCVASWAAVVVAESADDDEDATEQTEELKEKTSKKEYSPDGLGLQVRGAHIEGQGVPQSESITPIEVYLDLRARQPGSASAQIDFASVLVYREREYLAMFSSRWMMGESRPSRSASSPFRRQ